jgi:hypothetical protein
MLRFDAGTARNALGKIFWGTLICVLDFHFSQTTNGSGFRFDVISDVVGTALIAWGLGQLRPLVPDAVYASILTFGQAVAVFAVLDALADHIITPWPLPLRLLRLVFSLLCLWAIYRFCFAMQLLTGSLALSHVVHSWRASGTLFLWLNLAPAVILHAISLPVMFSRERAHLDLGPLAIAIVIAAFIPLVHILVSIWRTRKALDQFMDPAFPP